MNTLASFLVATAIGATIPASAQRILVADSASDTVMEFSPVDGSLISMNVIDLAAVTGGAASVPIEIINGPGGELWVSDQVSDAVFRLSPDGQTLLGTAAGPLDNVRGLAPFPGGALLANFGVGGGAPGGTLVQLDAMATTLVAHEGPLISSPFDVEPFEFNGVDGYLVTENSNDDIIFVNAADPTDQQVFHDSDGLAGVDFPEQVHVTADGRVFAAGFSAPSGIYEYDPLTGAELNYFDTTEFDIGGLRGVYVLGDGRIMVTSGDGVFIYNVNTGTLASVVEGVSARFVSVIDDENGGFGMNYCMAAVNSSGMAASMSASGSLLIADNDLTLMANDLPINQFGFFIVSGTQDFIMNPNGSDGNLCLGGAIGRFSGPGEIFSSGSTGSFSLGVDLTRIPTPTGTVATTPNTTWNFQAWVRDAGGTSNFTDGIEITFE